MANRPAMPMAIGVLMLVFGTLALAATAVALYLVTRDDVVADTPDVAKYAITVLLLPDFIVACVELSAGIGLVRYRAAGPERAMHFAIMRILATVAGSLYLAETNVFVGTAVVRAAIGVAWPVIVLACLSRLRRSCDAPVPRSSATAA